jgi:hypothetical protein
VNTLENSRTQPAKTRPAGTPAIPLRKLKSLKTKLATITADLDYARKASYDYWIPAQMRRSAFSIRKKQAAIREILDDLELHNGLDLSELRAAIETMWRALSQEWCPAENERPDIVILYRKRVHALLKEVAA